MWSTQTVRQTDSRMYTPTATFTEANIRIHFLFFYIYTYIYICFKLLVLAESKLIVNQRVAEAAKIYALQSGDIKS